ncbi:MAG: flavin reductase [Bdellovibrionota bacterium]|nr:flavin reductase [Bdellovibrionota bacterium]
MNLKIESREIIEMESRYRVHFINSLSGFKSANLVATVDKKGRENLSIVSSCFHLGADPALIGFISRPHSVPRHTLENILETEYFSINHVNKDIIKNAHQTSARYEKEESEFLHCKLTSTYEKNFKAPFVEESKIKIGLKKEEVIRLKNNTELVIGKIELVIIPENCLKKDGFIDIEKSESICVSGLDSYHFTNKVARLSYAKKNKDLEELVD